MKKILALLLCLSLCAAFIGCSTASGTLQNNSADSSAEPQVTATPAPTATPETTPAQIPAVNDEMLQMMTEVILTAAPGTAGSSLKAVTAVSELVNWMAANKPDSETVALTVDSFMTTYTDKEEALWAFELMESVFTQITAGSAAMDSLLDAAGLTAEDFAVTEDSVATTGRFFAAVDKYK